MKRERLTRDDLNHLDAPRPLRRIHRDPPELPVHYRGFAEPAPCGLAVGTWAARTNRPDLVTCPGCRQLRRVVLVSGAPGAPAPIVELSLPALRELARAYEGGTVTSTGPGVFVTP